MYTSKDARRWANRFSSRKRVVKRPPTGSPCVAADGVKIQLRYGTGTAPTNGAALTGAAFGSAKTFLEPVAGDKGGFALAFPLTGLTIGTTYWLDVSLAAVTAGNATITDVDILAMEGA